jgi:hypothetical protein
MVWVQNCTIYHEIQTLAELMGNALSFWGADDHPQDPDQE